MSTLSIEQKWQILVDQQTSIESLMLKFPDQWDQVKVTVSDAIKVDRPDHINELITKADATARHWNLLVKKSGQTNRIKTQAIPHLVKSRMIHLSFQKILTSSLGGTPAKIRQSAVDKILCNRIFYYPYREHRPVNNTLQKILWPLVRDKPAAVGVAKNLGFYCFFTNRFIDMLIERLAGSRVLEIGAGSGLLTLLLQKRGIDCLATDDLSWGHAVRYGRHVENLDAASALKKYRPQAVVCSWPPPGNQFEQQVFNTEQVENYIAIGSVHQFATGARSVYAKQNVFNVKSIKNEGLIAPREIDAEILWFTRK